ncbi:NAD(P)-binding protein [Lophium mytilinum]|uniref:NAD(P)-binding protein n=1 Tax=Lophium mytilinum TaxID=390894 RepID=A0A6A6R1X1_9PEZI|nr:NAD(P)-binding protein [Lophium mytilinum]
MPHTLVTGANSFVAAHIINELIAQGHTVTGSVRRTAAGDALLAENPEWAGKLDFVVVEDYAKDGAFDAIFQAKDYDHIVHVAAPLFGEKQTDFDRDFLRPGVDGNLVLLKGAKAHAPTLKSVVITGSINSLTGGSPAENDSTEYTNDFWNPVTPEVARESGDQYVMYQSSKKEGELAVWEFVKNEKPQFSVTVLLPSLIFGPPLQPLPDLKHINFSVGVVYNFFNGTFIETPQTHAAGLFPSYIDARDLATAHVRALTTPGAANKRFLVGGAELTSTLIVETLRGLVEKGELPELKGRLPKNTGKDTDLSLARIGVKEGNDVLGLSFRSAEETFGDLAKKVLELEKKEGK